MRYLVILMVWSLVSIDSSAVAPGNDDIIPSCPGKSKVPFPGQVKRPPPNYESWYVDAKANWSSAEEMTGWVGRHFSYDRPRAMELASNRKDTSCENDPVYTSQQLFTKPKGVCMDLARFGVETLKEIAPQTKPAYVMIEFESCALKSKSENLESSDEKKKPAKMTLHWLVSYKKKVNGVEKLFFTGDTADKGAIYGPYDVGPTGYAQFKEHYAAFRGRAIKKAFPRNTYRSRACSGSENGPRNIKYAPTGESI